MAGSTSSALTYGGSLERSTSRSDSGRLLAGVPSPVALSPPQPAAADEHGEHREEPGHPHLQRLMAKYVRWFFQQRNFSWVPESPLRQV